MGPKPRESVERVRDALAAKKPRVSKVASAPVRAGRSTESDVAESFRRARSAVGDVARDVKQLRGRAGSLVKKQPSRGS
jgi:hypothetical protein